MNFSVKLFCGKKIVKRKWLNVNKFVERFPEKIRKTEEAKLFTNFSVKYFLQKKIVKLKWIFFHDFFWLKMFPEKKCRRFFHDFFPLEKFVKLKWLNVNKRFTSFFHLILVILVLTHFEA